MDSYTSIQSFTHVCGQFGFVNENVILFPTFQKAIFMILNYTMPEASDKSNVRKFSHS